MFYEIHNLLPLRIMSSSRELELELFLLASQSHLNALSLDLSRPRLFKTLPSLKSSRRPVYIPRATYYYKNFGINLVHAQF